MPTREATPFQIWLNEQINEKRWSGQDVADLVGVSVAGVGRWRRAESQPKRQHVPKLAAAFSVRPEFLEHLLLGEDERAGHDRSMADYLAYRLPARFTLAEARRLILLAQTLREWDDEMLREAHGRLNAGSKSALTARIQES